MSSWLPIPLRDLPDEPPMRPTIGPGLFYPGLRHIVSPEVEAGKSWLGHAACQDEVKKGHHVAWVDLEMNPQMVKQRLRELGFTGDEWDRFHYFQPHEVIDVEMVRWWLHEPPVAGRLTMVVIDAMAGALDL